MWSRISDSYKRWRHSRGYGVHSPFGYRIVTEAIRPHSRYGWYGYAAIRRECHSESQQVESEARMLLRIASIAGVKSVYLPSQTPQAYREAFRAACRAVRITNRLSAAQSCQMICSEGDFIPLDMLLNYICQKDSEDRILAIRNIPQGWRRKLFDVLPEGLMLYGKRNVLIFRRSAMQKVAYSISI